MSFHCLSRVHDPVFIFVLSCPRPRLYLYRRGSFCLFDKQIPRIQVRINAIQLLIRVYHTHNLLVNERSCLCTRLVYLIPSSCYAPSLALAIIWRRDCHTSIRCLTQSRASPSISTTLTPLGLLGTSRSCGCARSRRRVIRDNGCTRRRGGRFDCNGHRRTRDGSGSGSSSSSPNGGIDTPALNVDAAEIPVFRRSRVTQP